MLLPTLLALGLLGFWAGAGFGALPSPPTVSLPTVTVPPLPPLPIPTVTVPPKVDPPAIPEVATPTSPNDLPEAVPQTAPRAVPGVPRAGGVSSVERTRISRVRTSRGWIARSGPHRSRGVSLSFSLSAPAVVVIRIDELARRCASVGAFRVRGHAGRNVVRFRGRLHGRKLKPGTYRLIAHPRAERAQLLAGVTLVILKRPAEAPAAIDADRAANMCPNGLSATEREAVQAAAPPATGGVAGVTASTRRRAPDEGAFSAPIASAVRTLDDAAKAIPPALFAMAALAVMLLAVASMPQPLRTSRTGAMLVHKRGSIALAGAAALAMAIATYLLL